MKRILCIWLPHGPSRESLVALAAHCDRFSPAVGVEASAHPDSLLLDITGLAHLFGGEAALARRIVGEFEELLNGTVPFSSNENRDSPPVRVAIADTLGAAWAAAHASGTGPFFASGTGPFFGERASFASRRQAENMDLSPSAAPPLIDVERRERRAPTQSVGTSYIRVVPPGETAAALRPLPIELLRLSEETVGLVAPVGNRADRAVGDAAAR